MFKLDYILPNILKILTSFINMGIERLYNNFINIVINCIIFIEF